MHMDHFSFIVRQQVEKLPQHAGLIFRRAIMRCSMVVANAGMKRCEDDGALGFVDLDGVCHWRVLDGRVVGGP